MAIEVYNLDTNASNDIYNVSSSDIASNEYTGTTYITRDEIDDIISDALSAYSDILRVGSALASEIFVVDSNGLRLGGSDMTTAPFAVYMNGDWRVGSLSGNYITWDTSTGTFTSNGAFSVSELHIPDENTTANSFHVDSDGNVWWGCTHDDFTADNDNAAAYVLKTGAAKLQSLVTIGSLTDRQFLDFNNATTAMEVSGKTTFLTTLTVGWDLEKGEFCSIESDGKVYPTRVTSIDTTENSNTTDSISGGVSAQSCGTDRISDTILFSLFIDTGPNLQYEKVTFNKLDGTFSAITATNVAGSGNLHPYVKRHDDTSCLICYDDGTDLYIRVVSALNTTVTLNAETTISDAIYGKIAKYSDTEYVLVYEEQSTGDLKAVEITKSGTTLTAGAEQSVLTATTGATPSDITRYGSTDYFTLVYNDNAQGRAVTFSFDGSSWSFGSSVTVSTSSVYPSIDNLDSTRSICTYSDASNARAAVISISGTTTTVNTSLAFDTLSGGIQGNSVVALGEDSAVVMWVSATGGGTSTMETTLLRIDSTTVTNADTNQTVSSVVDANVDNKNDFQLVKLGPEYVCYVYSEKNGAAYTVDFSSRFLNTNFDDFLGVVGADTLTDADGGIVLSGYSDDFSGLTAGQNLYLDCDGAYTTETYDVATRKAATALSATEVKLNL